MNHKTDYDRRLFSGGLRKSVHESRFNWLNRATAGMAGTVIELGCFNGRSLDYLSFSPISYLGLDAGWEGGLEEAIEKYPQHSFKKSIDPNDIQGIWDLAIALETLEHIPRPENLESYIYKLSKHSKNLIITVPNEIGLIFSIKFLYKKYIYRNPDKHTLREFFLQSLGRCDLVVQDEHRGFDYRELIINLEKYFYIKKVEGVTGLPKILSTQIGIVATSKNLNVSD